MLLKYERAFTDLVTSIRSGPPVGYFRIGSVRRFPNLNEFFVHHEDLRRANDLAPRTTAAAEGVALYRNVARRVVPERGVCEARASSSHGPAPTWSSGRGEYN